MNILAFNLEDPMHRTRDYLQALLAILSQGSLDEAGQFAAIRVLYDAMESNSEAEEQRSEAFELSRKKAA